jgi:hypothetical protein
VNYALDALNARRLWNYLRLMEMTKRRLRDIVDEADKAAQEGKMV